MKQKLTRTAILARSLGEPRYRRLAFVAGALYFILYLYAIGQILLGSGVISPRGSPNLVVASSWLSKLLKPIAGYTFEPVAALYLSDGFAVFLSPVNLMIGVVLGVLIALNVASAAYSLATVRSCRRLSWTGLLSSLPALLTGFACCVPTVGLVLGANFALALISLQGYLLPASVAGLVAGLLWNLSRTRKELSRAES